MARDRLAAMRANQSNAYESHQAPPSLKNGYQTDAEDQTDGLEMQEKSLEIDNFMNQISDLNDMIRTINGNIEEIRQLYSRSISELTTEASPTNSSAGPAHLLAEANARTNQMIKSCKNRIETLNGQINRSRQPKHQLNVHITQISSIKKRLMDTIIKYQSVEQENRQKTQARIERQYRIVNPDATPEEIKQVVESDQSNQIFSQALVGSSRYGDARAAFNEVKERQQQIKQIESTLTELMEMFNDLATMVEEQDHMIQDVENHAAEIDKDMESAGQHISKARDSAAAARKKRWICFFIILLLLAIAGAVVAIVVVTNNRKTSTSTSTT